MKFAFYIASRYLVSQKSLNVINIITKIAIVGVCTGTMALVIVLSVMNGINELISNNFTIFDPDLKITVAEGKSFSLDEGNFNQIKNLPEIASFTEIIEENALLEYDKRMSSAVVKGVPSNYAEIIQLDTIYMTEGEFLLNKSPHEFAVLGQGLSWYLSVGLSFTNPIKFYAPKKGGAKQIINVNNALVQDYLFPRGVFSIQQDFDSKYIFVPFDFARNLFQMKDKVSFVEIETKPDTDIDKLQNEIQEILGDKFVVKNQFEQHETIFKVMKSEKWFIVLILSFILVIASFNILGSLTMLIIDKKHDIAILQSMGAENKLIRRIFLLEGWLISIIGAFAGILIGTLIAWLQMKYGLLKLPGAEGSYIMSAYPVQIQIPDLIISFLIVSAIGFLASWYPVRYISGKYLSVNKF